MKIVRLCAVLLAFMAAQAGAATNWVAGRDLRINELSPNELLNPNGSVPEWSYGLFNPNTNLFAPHAAAQHLDLPNGLQGYQSPTIFVNTLAVPLVQNFGPGPIQAILPDEIALHPEANGTRPDIRWTAPQTGNYSVSFYFQDADPYGGDGGSGHVRLNGSEIFFESWSNGGGASSFFEQIFQAGDVLDFALGTNGDYSYDTTRFDATIATVVPVPAALWLFGPALGGLCLSRRRTA